MRAILLGTCSWLAVTTATLASGELVVVKLGNGDMERVNEHGRLDDWIISTPGFDAFVSELRPFEGRGCLELRATRDQAASAFGNVMQAIDPTAHRGKSVRYSAAVRYEGPGRAQLWMRVDRVKGLQGFFDNMNDRPITHADWRRHEIIGPVAGDALRVNVGLIIVGGGTAWLDDVRLETIGEQVERIDPPRALNERGLRNLTALAQLLGYVRLFYPGDEAAETEWDAFTVDAIRAVEPAEGDEALAAALRSVIEPIAPAMRVLAGPMPVDADDPPSPPDGVEPDQIVAWVHRGVGLPGGIKQSPYSSTRTFEPWPAQPGAASRIPAPHLIVRRPLGENLWCAWPVTLLVHDGRTLPAAAPHAAADREPVPSAVDRSVRLAGVVLAWTALNQFYPYFDVVETDWQAALAEALTKAAVDEDVRSYWETLSRMVASLHDGHGMVGHPSAWIGTELPLLWRWIGDELVVTASGAPGVARGDVVLEIDGTPATQWRRRCAELISGATPQWIDHRGATMLRSQLPTGDPARLAIRRIDGTSVGVLLPRVPRGSTTLVEIAPRPANGAEVAPGIVYFNLDGASAQALNDAMPALEKAAGIVFDLRGYPGDAGFQLFSHLSDRMLTSAQWHVPRVVLPDERRLQFDRLVLGEWRLMPRQPRLTQRIAFITDGRAISYAESCLGIVEHYRLGEIVGEPTAGTNGNVNVIRLPGGYVINFTGMKVLKHDGSQHHGIGIRPTVLVVPTVAGIAAGSDELLERAIQTLNVAAAR